MIILWAGAIVDIPDGFKLCNGSNGTPDLRNNFIVGAGDTYAVDANGGSLTHIHTLIDYGHTHNLVAGPGLSAGATYSDTTGSGQANGFTSDVGHLPPYYALAYIMKT